MNDHSSSSLRTRLRAVLYALAWALSLFIAWKGLVNYWFFLRMPGLVTALPALALIVFVLRRAVVQIRARSLRESWKAWLACALLLLLAKIDLMQLTYRPALFDVSGANHEAVHVLVDRERLREIGIGQFIKGAFYAPGESDRDLYLYAGNPWRRVLSGVTSLAAFPMGDTLAGPKWRTATSAPLYDVRYLPAVGRLLATQKRPPELLLIDPAKLVVEKRLTWTLGGMPALIYDLSNEGRKVTIIAEGEGEVGELDVSGWTLSGRGALAPQAREIGVPFAPYGLAPFEASPSFEGRRYLSVWQDTPVLLELTAGPRVARAFDLRPAPRFADFHTFRFTGVALDAARGRAYVADSFDLSSGRIVEVDLESMRLVRTTPAPLSVRLLILDSERRRLYAGAAFTGDFIVYDIAANGALSERTRLDLGRALRVLQWDVARPRALLAASAHGVFLIDVDRL